jgi:AraC-like DNA-binding protein
LSEILHSIRLSSEVFSRWELRAPWGVRLSPNTQDISVTAKFHLVESGHCWLKLDGQKESIPLASGDILVLPRALNHTMSDEPNRTATPLEQLALRHRVPGREHQFALPGRGATTELVCGVFRAETNERLYLFDQLPDVVLLPAAQVRASPGLESTLRQVFVEAASQLPGRSLMTARLMEVLFIQVLRAWMTTQEVATDGWLRALRDPQIAKAIECLHRAPAENWKVATLARAVGMSRSALAARFSELVGQGPIEYLQRWRIHLAAMALCAERNPVADIGARVGYQSEVTFSRAFKREMGIAPRAYRRAHRQLA